MKHIDKSKIVIDCTGDTCIGDIIKFQEDVFRGSFRHARLTGKRTITAEVVGDSYGKKKLQHTFTLKLIDCTGIDFKDVLETAKSDGHGAIKRKGRNVYKNGTLRMEWSDESKRTEVLAEKHARGDEVREYREMEKAYDCVERNIREMEMQ